MALTRAAIAALVALSACERLPEGPGALRWERELDVQGLGRASDGDLFVTTSDGTLSRLDPDGEARWAISSDYRGDVAVSPGDEVAVVSARFDVADPVVTLLLLDGRDGSPIVSHVVESVDPFRRNLHGFAALEELIAVVGADTHEDPDTGEVFADSTSFVEVYDRDGAVVKRLEFAWSPEHRIARDPRGGFVVFGFGAGGDTDLGLGPLAPGEDEVTFLARFDDGGELMSQHLVPELVNGDVCIGNDGAIYFTGAAHPGDPYGVLTRADETGAIEWQIGIHGEEMANASTYAVGVDGSVVYAGGRVDGTPGFGRLPDPVESGTDQLPPDQESFLLSVDAATGAVRWQRGLTNIVDPPLVVDAARGFYLLEGRLREFDDGAGYVPVLAARGD